MKILIIRAANAIGGAEIYNLNLIKGFRKYYPEDKLIFITTLPEFSRRIREESAEAITLSVFSEEVGTKRGILRLIPNFLRYILEYLKAIFRINAKKKIRVVWIHSATEKIVFSPILNILGFKVVWLEQGPFFAFPKTRIILCLYKFISRFVRKIITVSKDGLEDLVKNGIEKGKVICIHTGMNTVYFSPAKKADKNLIVGYVGAICEEKGVMEFLEVTKKIIKKVGRFKKFKGLRFVLTGNGPALKKVRSWIKKRGLHKWFIVPGRMENVRDGLEELSVFFFPTKHLEGISLALLESMAMGVPVVARDIGGNRELVVHGKTGYLFKNETPEELADIIINLLKDEKEREAMGRAARERIVKYFNEERWIRKLHLVFKEVAKK